MRSINRSFFLLLTIVFLFAVQTFHAQEQLPEMATDRPDQTETPSLVPIGWFQFEFGTALEESRTPEQGLLYRTVVYPTALMRYGLLENWELRLEMEYASAHQRQEHNITGFRPLVIGSKIALCTEQGWRPHTALIGHIVLPYFGRKEFCPEFIIPQFRFTMEHTLSEMFSLSYNLGMEWEDPAEGAIGVYTLSLGMDATEHIGLFIEAYGSLPERNGASHNIDGGLTYSITPHIQWDASGGFGLTDTAPDYFMSSGLSFRLSP